MKNNDASQNKTSKLLLHKNQKYFLNKTDIF